MLWDLGTVDSLFILLDWFVGIFAMCWLSILQEMAPRRRPAQQPQENLNVPHLHPFYDFPRNILADGLNTYNKQSG